MVYNTTPSEATEKIYKRLETGRQPWRKKDPQQAMALPSWSQERLPAPRGLSTGTNLPFTLYWGF
jgi:hypothetical protein